MTEQFQAAPARKSNPASILLVTVTATLALCTVAVTALAQGDGRAAANAAVSTQP
jgi:hypothetical protein